MKDKTADLAGPGISTYPEVAKSLPKGYHTALTPMETMKALFAMKGYIEEGLCRELNLQMVQVPLIVTRESGINDMLDRDGSRTPVEFPCGLGITPRLNAQVVQAATKWKRPALRQFGCAEGEGICTDMRAIRKDYFLDHDHSAYVDQWDWERVITAADRNLGFLRDIVSRIWKVLHGAGVMAAERYPALAGDFPPIPETLKFVHAEEILEMYPDLPRKERETRLLQEFARLSVQAAAQPAATWADLTPREVEVLNLLATGATDKQIAARLSLSPHTVKSHVRSILSKLHAVNRRDAVRLASRPSP